MSTVDLRGRGRRLLGAALLAATAAVALPVPARADLDLGRGVFGASSVAPAGTALALLDAAHGLGSLAAAARPAATPVVFRASASVSGLPWRSGAKMGSCLATGRARQLDVNHIFITTKSFAEMVRQSGANWPRQEAKKAPLLLVSLPLLTNDTQSQFAQCAAGAFDASFRQIGANLAKAGAQSTILRLGWEANIGSDVHPWGVDTAAQIPAYKACWRRAATQLKVGFPGLMLDWTSSKKTANKEFRATDMYPGDDVVDVWGVHYYNTGPQKNTQAVWDKYYNILYNNGPWGIGAWLAAAKAHGKKLGVGEWAVWQQGVQTAAQADDPVFVDNMYRFFRDNAADIAYESYQNSIAAHALCPSAQFPLAAARYNANWGLAP